MAKNFNNQFATQRLREESVDETSTTSGVGVYHKKKGERTTGGIVYKDLWTEAELEEVFSKEDYAKVVKILDKIMNTDPKAFYAILQKVTATTPYKYSDIEKLIPQINEDWGSSDQTAMNRDIHRALGSPTELPKFDDLMSAAESAVDFYWSDWPEYTDPGWDLVKKAARSYLRAYFLKSANTLEEFDTDNSDQEENDYWTNKLVKIVKGSYAGHRGETIGGGKGTVDVKITSNPKNPIVTVKQDDVKIIGDSALNENYSKFKKETRLKTGTKQYYEGMKIAERKLKEANSIIEYINKLKTEISESEGEIKENSHIFRTKERMTKKIAEIYSKFKSI